MSLRDSIVRRPSPLHPHLEDIEASFLVPSSSGAMTTATSKSVQDKQYDVNELNQRLHEFMMRTPESMDIPVASLAQKRIKQFEANNS